MVVWLFGKIKLSWFLKRRVLRISFRYGYVEKVGRGRWQDGGRTRMVMACLFLVGSA